MTVAYVPFYGLRCSLFDIDLIRHL